MRSPSFVTAILITASAAFGQDYPKLSPFDGHRWAEDRPEVQVGTRWYALVALDETPAEEIVAFAKRSFGRRYKKRVSEDLVEVLTRMGKAPGARVDLRLRPLPAGEEVTLRDVPMTAERRQRIELANDRWDLDEVVDPAAVSGPLAKSSPFDGMRWRDGQPEVRVGDGWYEPVALDDQSVGVILAFVAEAYGKDMVRKRFSEDLVEVLTRMGKQPGSTMKLTLRDPGSRQIKVVEGVALTEEKRHAIWLSNQDPDGSDGDDQASRMLSKDEALADLQQLVEAIDATYSYRDLRGFPWMKRIETLAKTVDGGATPRDLAAGLAPILAGFGDGHTRVRGLAGFLPTGWLPCSLAPFESRWIALTDDGAGAFDDEHPFLVAVDDVSLGRLAEAALAVVPKGSPAFVRHQLAHRLVDVQWLRGCLGLASRDHVKLTLAALDGRQRTREVPVGAHPPRSRARVAAHHELLDDRIGYLRLPSMDTGPLFQERLENAMEALADTRGLIIDVRDNGGGSREALRLLLPWILRPDQSPRVVNVAAYRIPGGRPVPAPETLLADRFLFPADWSGWSDAERASIRAVAERFRPDWTLPEGAFTPWYFAVVTKADEKTYDAPVIVLMNEGCFSATDIFLAAFQGLPQVTLMGTPSGGGSGRARSITLRHSGLRILLSTIASFRPDGRRYDGIGITPDVLHTPTLTDVVGSTDSLLDAACARLRR